MTCPPDGAAAAFIEDDTDTGMPGTAGKARAVTAPALSKKAAAAQARAAGKPTVRRRVLLAILLAVTVTACLLGIPLGYTATAIVENLTREDLAGRVRQIAAILDDEVASGHQVDLRSVQLAVPTGAHLLVTLPDTGKNLTLGPQLRGDTVSEEVPIVQHGTVRLSIDAGPMRTTQTQVAVLVALVVVATIGIGFVVASVTARRLARPLRHVADRASFDGLGSGRGARGLLRSGRPGWFSSGRFRR